MWPPLYSGHISWSQGREPTLPIIFPQLAPVSLPFCELGVPTLLTGEIAVAPPAAFGGVEAPVVGGAGGAGAATHVLHTGTLTALHVTELVQGTRGITITT